MGNVALTLLTMLLLQSIAAAGWALSGSRLSQSRSAAFHWSAFALLGVAALGLALARGIGPGWITVHLAGLLAVLGLLAMRRGMLLFLRQPRADAEAVATTAGVAVATSLAGLWESDHTDALNIGVHSMAMLWVMLRTSVQTWPALRQEFGERTALLIISPLIAGVTLYAFRLGALVLLPSRGMPMLPQDSAPNVAVALTLLLLGVLQHGSLAVMVLLRMVNKLRRLSQHDALTGLYNRAEWLRQLDAQHRWLGRYGEPYALLMIDVDHFKKVNDTLGHAAGDAVLVTIAQVLTASARDVDVVGRIGGEEFCVLLPRADPASARRTAERLRQTIADTEIAWRQQSMRVTVSIGLAMVGDADETPPHALERADHALYQAKRAGRDRVWMSRTHQAP